MSSPDTTPEQCLRRKLLVGHLAYSGVVTLLATTLFFVLFAIHHNDVTEHPREAVLLILAALALIVLQLLGTFWCLTIARRYTSALTDLRQLIPGAYGILEPSADAPLVSLDEVDFAILPCLTCNHLGQRLGQGGGYYDRFLSHYRGGTVLLCREKLIREEIPLEPHDYPVPWVLTERGLYEDGTPARLC